MLGKPGRRQLRRVATPVTRAALAAAGLVGIAMLVVVATYTAPAPDSRMELGFAAFDVLTAPGDAKPDWREQRARARHEFRADIQVDVKMSVKPWEPWNALRNLACAQSATITAVFSGTRQMWRDAARFGSVDRARHPGRSRIAAGVSPPVQDIVMRAAEGELSPLAPSFERSATGRTYRDAQLDVTRPAERVSYEDIPEIRPVTVQTATVHNWRDHHAPVVVKFEVPWTSFRSFGSCYVQLPRLLSTNAAFIAAQQRPISEYGNSYPPFARVTDALTRLDTDGSVLAAESQPAPTAAGAVEGVFELHDATWSCHSPSFDLGIDQNALAWSPDKTGLSIPPERRDPGLSLKAIAPPARAFRALENSRSCQAVAVISAPQAGWLQVVLLLLVGALLTPLALLFWKAGMQPVIGWIRKSGDRR